MLKELSDRAPGMRLFKVWVFLRAQYKEKASFDNDYVYLVSGDGQP